MATQGSSLSQSQDSAQAQGQPLSQMAKPDAGQYAARRKLFLVPIYPFPADAPDEAAGLLTRYWSEVRDQVQGLERSLGGVAHVFHEGVFAEGDEGMAIVEGMNPHGGSFAQALRHGGARLHATEDRALVMEHSDWQRCLSIGLMSERVMGLAMAGVQETAQRRFEHIGQRVAEGLGEGEVGALFISEGHRVQFAGDIQVFFVAPPAQDALKRWMEERMRFFAGADAGASAGADGGVNSNADAEQQSAGGV